MKRTFALSLCFLVLLSVLCGCQKKENTDLKATYQIHVDGYSWDAGVDYLVLTLDQPVTKVSKEDFSVTETKQYTDWNDPSFPIQTGTFERTVLDAYAVDEGFNRIDEKSDKVRIDLYCSPEEGTPLLYSAQTEYNTWSEPYFLTVSLNEDHNLETETGKVNSLVVDEKYTSMKTSADMFKVEEFSASDGVTYKYASYTPDQKTDTLFVYLHGQGEGGAGVTSPTDPILEILTDGGQTLAGEDFQTKTGGAAVIFPQCPTYWLDSDGKEGNRTLTDGNKSSEPSYYLRSLTELVDTYASNNGYTKIVIGGASNGGYMTMLMALEYGDKYTGYIPMCEAYADENISDEQIEKLAGLNMYFIYSDQDDVVDPLKFEVPTLNRINGVGSTSVHVSTTENIYDEIGQYLLPDGSVYKGEDGKPYMYGGHWAWVYFFNNVTSCNDCGIDVFSWIGEISK